MNRRRIQIIVYAKKRCGVFTRNKKPNDNFQILFTPVDNFFFQYKIIEMFNMAAIRVVYYLQNFYLRIYLYTFFLYLIL